MQIIKEPLKGRKETVCRFVGVTRISLQVPDIIRDPGSLTKIQY